MPIYIENFIYIPENYFYSFEQRLTLSVNMVFKFVSLQIWLGIVLIFHPTADSSFALLCLTCSPSDGVVILLAFLASADVTFSVTLAVIVNFAAIGKYYKSHLQITDS